MGKEKKKKWGICGLCALIIFVIVLIWVVNQIIPIVERLGNT